MKSEPPSILDHFRRISTPSSPRPVTRSRIFSRSSESEAVSGDQSSLAEQVRQLASQVDQQGAAVTELTSVVAGGGSALENAGSSLLGGSVLGGLASSAQSGFSWQSVVKDVLPFGGLISGIAGLFSSPAKPAPLEQYDAPQSLNFSGALGPNGSISQSSYDASGLSRGSSPGLNLVDAAGGPQPSYARGSDGSLQATAGDPSSRYSGVLDLSSAVRNMVTAISPAPSAPNPNPAAPAVPASRTSDNPGAAPGPVVPSPGNASAEAPALPAFDSQWFMDRAPYIAAAVRSAMLEYHPLVDVVNDL